MLTLRIMTLTKDEKRAMAAVDERAGALLARTEALARERQSPRHAAQYADATLMFTRPLRRGHG